MIEMIGLTTFCMLVWVLASSMATESDAEKRRCARMALYATGQEKAQTMFATKEAA